MVMYARSRSIYTQYNTAIDGLFDNGRGMVSRYAVVIMREMYDVSVAMAPERSGSLKQSHGKGGVLKQGSTRLGFTVWNNSPHAEYVHEGTLMVAPILPRGTRVGRKGAGAASSWLQLRPGPGYPFFSRAKSVRGQRANPWMDRAKDNVLARHGIR